VDGWAAFGGQSTRGQRGPVNALALAQLSIAGTDKRGADLPLADWTRAKANQGKVCVGEESLSSVLSDMPETDRDNSVESLPCCCVCQVGVAENALWGRGLCPDFKLAHEFASKMATPTHCFF